MVTKTRGFTLIELMIVVAIVGIISAIAYPSYVDYVIRSKRVDGMAALMNAAQAMERFRVNNYVYTNTLSNVYTTVVPIDGGVANKYYDLTLGNTSNTTYTLIATPTGSMAGKKVLQLTHTGAKMWGAKNCWPTSSTC